MGRLLKYLFFLVVIALIIVAAYALLFDLPAPEREIVTPVELENNQ